MITLLRTNSDNPDFVALTKSLDEDLAHRDGKEHAFYAQFNKIDNIKHAIVFFDASVPVACGAMKECELGVMEIKRMYTLPASRGNGLASVVLADLEKWARELAYKKCILETGIKQPEAIELYQKNGYRIIPNYGQYADIAESRCFEKVLC